MQSTNESVLYRYERALDDVSDLGVVPRRFWKILYPLFRVEIEAEQWSATDFEPIEQLLETAIMRAELRSVEDLARFFALDQRLIENLINRLRAIGHIDLVQEPLTLTELGLHSLQERRAYSRLLTRHVLYFDAIRCQPLLRAHYRLQIYDMDEADALHGFKKLSHYYHYWDDEALEQLKAHPDYYAYNLPDEIKIETLQLARMVNRFDDIVYLPAYVVEHQPDGRHNLPRLLAFSQVHGHRDLVLEAGLNNDKELSVIFQPDSSVDLMAVITDELRRRGHRDEEWMFVPKGPHGPEVRLQTPQVPTANWGGDRSRLLTLLNVGRFFKVDIHDDMYCVWATCVKADERRQAVCERTVAWLEQSRSSRSQQAVVEWLTRRSGELDVSIPSMREVAQIAVARNAWKAVEQLELLEARV